MSEHGTTSRYTRGCRCARCRGANAGYQCAYQARRKGNVHALNRYASGGAPVRTGQAYVFGEKGLERFVTTTRFTVDVRSPLEQLVDACIDLRAAFAAYHQAHTQEPAA